jgi:hypothetical protein
VIGPHSGNEGVADQWPSVFLLRSSNPATYCSATVVGRRVLLTAAHCVRERQTTVAVKTKASSEDYQVNCSIHPKFAQDSKFDFALCSTDKPLPASRIERINADNGLVASGTPVTLVGYGCRDAVTRVFDGALSADTGFVASSARSDNAADTVVSGVAACPGDGGAIITSRQSSWPLINTPKRRSATASSS